MGFANDLTRDQKSLFSHGNLSTIVYIHAGIKVNLC